MSTFRRTRERSWTVPATIALSIALSTSCNWPERHPIGATSVHRAICILELIRAADYSLAQDELRRFEREDAGHEDLALVLEEWCRVQNAAATATRAREPLSGQPAGSGAEVPDRLQELRQAGMAHYSRGDVEDAVACWEKVVAAEPTDLETVKLLRRARAVLANKKKIQTNGPPPAVNFSTGGTAPAGPPDSSDPYRAKSAEDGNGEDGNGDGATAASSAAER